jgi:hypothetical protein
MNMKKFLIFFILIVFVTASCVVQKKWTKPYFCQEEFEKDREECLQAVKNDPQTSLTLEECLAKKGYESQRELSNVGKVLLIAVTLPMFGYLVAESDFQFPSPSDGLWDLPQPPCGYWFKPDADREQLQQDYSECRGKAEGLCMIEKGYTWATF